MLTDRIEKYKGVTLVVDRTQEWITVIWDATGHAVEGPITTDADVKQFVGIAIATLQQLREIGS